MKMLKTKISALLMCSALLLPNMASASTPAANATASAAADTSTAVVSTAGKTNVNGTWVPGYYVVSKDSRVVYIPGVGLVVVLKDTLLPKGSVYIN